MVAFNFSPEFADAVANGAKRQTIRKTARAKLGDALQLYTGQRTRKGALWQSENALDGKQELHDRRAASTYTTYHDLHTRLMRICRG